MNRNEEKILREYIRAELTSARLDEGAKDILKKALGTALSKLDGLISTLKRLNPISDTVIDAIEKNDGAAAISSVEALGQKFESDIASASDALPAPKQESMAYKRYRDTLTRRRRQPINEVALGGFEIIGLALAALGGVPLVLKMIAKLAKLMKFDAVAAKLESAYKSAHHFEEKVIDIVIPDRAMYAVYVMFEERSSPDRVANLKLYQDDPKVKLDGDRSMTLEEFSKSDVKKKYEKRVYALILLPWLISGLLSIEHMLHSWLGVLEGAATAEKSLFVGTRVAEIVPVVASDIGAAVSSLSKLG